MKLYRYFTEEDIKEYKIEDGKIYDEKSRIQSFAYISIWDFARSRKCYRISRND